ncbi:tumor necrosis factor receptor superfamily member 5 [Clarias gariepinus]|uniref:tumor necrosis factor receptor superfamily member 5-like n=1 Tax=Clarias gariepinus TaxID=13013 RepID=UPI00234DC362|nr:tumor necrosis factor receptor superfamily member 5-like [Clarias gariepinus]
MTCTEDKFEHDNTCCDKCPEGTHVSKYCTPSSPTECTQCNNGYYTENKNYVNSCLKCSTSCNSDGQVVKKDCTLTSDRTCGCKDDHYCTIKSVKFEDHCGKCEAFNRCEPGYGVSVPPNETQNTECEPCPAGTFNNKTDYHTPCYNHTRCADLGRVELTAGTETADATCGGFSPVCSWVVPASLWAGLTLTIIVVIIGVMCVKCKRRRKAVITVASSEQFISPVLPPDVIKHPRSPQIETITYNSKPCAEEHECSLECDGISVTADSEKRGAFSIPDTCMMFMSDPYKSEPQEDDWP